MGLNINFPKVGIILVSLVMLTFLLIAMMPNLSSGSSSIGNGFGDIWSTLFPFLIPLTIIIVAFLFVFR